MNSSDNSRHFHIEVCKPEQFDALKELVKKLELDDRQMSPEQFMVVEEKGELMGFARLVKYNGFAEVCTLGVPEQCRGKGIASRIMKAISESVDCPLYLVSIIPSFFSKLGFVECENYPTEIQEKLSYCRSNLPVDEKYVVMRAS